MHKPGRVALQQQLFGHVGCYCTKQLYNFVQVSELAEKAADRSTRVAACEFLHAVTLWMIGMQNTSNQLTDLMLLPVLLCAWFLETSAAACDALLPTQLQNVDS